VEELDAVLGRWVARDGESPVTYARPEAPVVDEAPGAEPEAPVLDVAVLDELRTLGGDGIVAELVGMFLEDTPPRLAALREAMQEGDAESIEGVAHALKGSAGNMGATRLAGVCARLENAGISRDLTSVKDLLPQAEAEFGRVRRALEVEAAG
jgi:two-component system, sensor histidine kinase and response regulator